MSEQPEARIVINRKHDGSATIATVDPKSGRMVRPMPVAAADVDRTVVKLKETLERAGDRVTVKET